MIDKLCVCGHAMEDRGAQTLEMNGSYLGSGLSTDYVDVKVFVCPLVRAYGVFRAGRRAADTFSQGLRQ